MLSYLKSLLSLPSAPSPKKSPVLYGTLVLASVLTAGCSPKEITPPATPQQAAESLKSLGESAQTAAAEAQEQAQEKVEVAKENLEALGNNVQAGAQAVTTKIEWLGNTVLEATGSASAPQQP